MRQHEDEIHSTPPLLQPPQKAVAYHTGIAQASSWGAGLVNWKTDFRSIYYDGAPAPADLVLPWAETALLIIDVQNAYLARPDRAALSPDEQRRYDAWIPFHRRLAQTVIPNTKRLLGLFRRNGIESLFARIACHTRHGRDRSLSPKRQGWNNL